MNYRAMAHRGTSRRPALHALFEHRSSIEAYYGSLGSANAKSSRKGVEKHLLGC